ncbi:MAG: cytochrome b [Steroidobacteraceae bacterium]
METTTTEGRATPSDTNTPAALEPHPMHVPARGTSDSYTRVAVALHWLIAALLLAQIAFGWFLTTIARGTPMRSIDVNFHKSTGITIGALILLRILWRLLHTPPPLPTSMPAWQRTAARANHVALYALMLTMPLSGYIASNFSKYGIKFYNAVKLAPWGIDDHRVYALFNSIHVIAAYVFVAIIAVHVLAAAQHAIRGDRVLSRMWV